MTTFHCLIVFTYWDIEQYVCWTYLYLCDVINFENNPNLLIKPFFLHNQKVKKKKIKYLQNEKKHFPLLLKAFPLSEIVSLLNVHCLSTLPSVLYPGKLFFTVRKYYPRLISLEIIWGSGQAVRMASSPSPQKSGNQGTLSPGRSNTLGKKDKGGWLGTLTRGRNKSNKEGLPFFLKLSAWIEYIAS